MIQKARENGESFNIFVFQNNFFAGGNQFQNSSTKFFVFLFLKDLANSF